MKAKKPHYFIGNLILISILFSCIHYDDFELAKPEINEPEIKPNTDIIAIKHAYDQSGKKIYTFDESDTSIIEVYVISSDEGGNFYKKMIVQDKNENPTSGIEVLIDLRAYFTKFNFGRKIYIKMAGLSVSNDEGKYIIGYSSRNDVEGIPEYLIDDFIVRSGITQDIIPKQITFGDFTNSIIGTYVQFKNVQFRNDEIGKTYAGETFDEFDGERVLVQCDNQLTTILSTSTYSDFKSNLLPDKKGTLNSVLTKDYSSEKFILVLNNISTVSFVDQDRCDPIFLYCEGNSNKGTKLIFYEDFENIKKTEDLEKLGWNNINANFGAEKYKKITFNGNNAIRISAYNSAENPLEVWLVSPVINLDNTIDEILTFETKASYDDGTILSTWISADFDGSIRDATWQQLDVNISIGPGTGYGTNFTNSGNISLSCLNGNIHFAFRYTGGDPGIGTTYEIDNIKIIGN
jgi:hypothetical protein